MAHIGQSSERWNQYEENDLKRCRIVTGKYKNLVLHAIIIFDNNAVIFIGQDHVLIYDTGWT